MKQFSHRLVERPRWEQFDSFTAQFVIVLMMKMMKPINGNGNVENATATIGKVGGSGDCFFPSLETHKDVLKGENV